MADADRRAAAPRQRRRADASNGAPDGAPARRAARGSAASPAPRKAAARASAAPARCCSTASSSTAAWSPLAQADGRDDHDDRRACADGERLHAVQQAFVEYGGAQCGICTPGMVLAAVDAAGAQSASDRGRDPRRRSPAICAAAPATCGSSKRSLDAVRSRGSR